jgi:hypothetical protein
MWLGPQSVEETERVDSAGTLEGHHTGVVGTLGGKVYFSLWKSYRAGAIILSYR